MASLETEKKKLRLALVGANGRMGTAIRDLLAGSEHFELAVALDRENEADHPGSDRVDVILDVSTPAATERRLSELSRAGARTPYVIGCTGWTESQLAAVRAYARQACVVLAPNFSPGVNLLLELIERAAPLLSEWGYGVAIHETHHVHKADAPSGTAKAILERLVGMSPQVRSTREGTAVGTHEVRFTGPHDVLTFTHEALDRSSFARGALLAAQWACRRQGAGLHSMQDVIRQTR